jgi:hypothetical protein
MNGFFWICIGFGAGSTFQVLLSYLFDHRAEEQSPWLMRVLDVGLAAQPELADMTVAELRQHLELANINLMMDEYQRRHNLLRGRLAKWARQR